MTTTPHYTDQTVTLYDGDCLDVLAELPDASVDSVCTDPPYGLEFMGKDWDRPWAVGMSKPGYADADRMARPAFGDSRNANCRSCGGRQRGAKRCDCTTPQWDRHPREDMRAFGEWCQLWATECLRVLKPGGHLLAFGGTRTSHRLACAIEDAGFEIRDSIAWLYGSGFPKSLDVGKAIDRAAGVEREVTGSSPHNARRSASSWQAEDGRPHGMVGRAEGERLVTAPATTDAQRWHGFGTALKPAHEPIVVARKPLAGTVAANVLAHGTGALNVDGCRVGTTDNLNGGAYYTGERRDAEGASSYAIKRGGLGEFVQPAGRWPANVVLDESQAAALDAQSGETTSGNLNAGHKRGSGTSSYDGGGGIIERDYGGDTGGASRFFYTAKAGSAERVKLPKPGGEPQMLDQKNIRECRVCGSRSKPSNGDARSWPSCGHEDWAWAKEHRASGGAHSSHPTVKPLALMRWLVRLVTPPGGVVLEPFAGSGTTVEACILEGFRCVAIERETDYIPLIVQRINRRRDPVAAARATGEDMGLFGLLDQPEGQDV